MSVSSASAPVPGSKAIAATALRNAGLIDRDAPMRDATDTPGGRKGKLRSGRTSARISDLTKDRPMSNGTRMHPIRLSASTGSSDSISIRGAARPSALGGRIRRNAVSGTGSVGSASQIPVRISTKPKAVEAWRELVQKRYNAEAKYLNLDSMIDDEVVKKYNLTPPGFGGNARDAAVIFKLASQLKPEVQTLSLANNNLTGVLLTQMHKYLPGLVNLSLQNNKLKEKREVSMISPRKEKMPNLRELVLTGNPLRENAIKNGQYAVYRSDVVRRFAALEVLDQEPVSQISFDAPHASTSDLPVEKPSATTFPFPMGPSFVAGIDGATFSDFLVRYFNALDSQRETLVNAYDPAATFSFSVNTTIPTRAKLSGFHTSMPNQRKLIWGDWLEVGSRNLNRIGSDPEKMLSNLHIGSDKIIETLVKLPRTNHDINGSGEKFCIDAYPVPHSGSMALLTTVHGEFTEPSTGGIRSFDRTFMLVPAPEGSRAKLNGWNIVILSDQWIIRCYSSHEAWKAGPLLVQALPKQEPFTINSLPADQQTALASLPEAQRNLVVQVCAQTKLNARFAVDCLAGNEWDLTRAIANFNQVKDSLAPDAFL
ncbi:NTF2-like protein [Agrocybe pediades]|nr:NTF2-like protein [Agrocybe pediades]